MAPHDVATNIRQALDTGLIEFVPSQTVADILAEHKTLTRYIAMNNPDPVGHGRYPCHVM